MFDELVLATRNVGKARELRALAAPFTRRVLDLGDIGVAPDPAEDDLETGTTFLANALSKARYFAARASRRPVLADDSGLCVRALDGAPGVYSRRYAGAVGDDETVSAANRVKLLAQLQEVEDRRAEFVCAVALVTEDATYTAVGRTTGRILTAPCGSEGFGYDALFWSDDLGCSFGEATEAAKSEVSHRGRAMTSLARAARHSEAE